jgi:hypothetical protein
MIGRKIQTYHGDLLPLIVLTSFSNDIIPTNYVHLEKICLLFGNISNPKSFSDRETVKINQCLSNKRLSKRSKIKKQE